MRQAWARVPDHSTEPQDSDSVGIDFRELIINEPVARLIRAIEGSVAAGCRHIHIGIESPGGACDVQEQLVNTMRDLQVNGVQISTYNTHLVQSAAVACFLAAQRRWCAEKAQFLIHNPRGDGTRDKPGPFAEAHQFFKTAFYALRTNVTQRVWDVLSQKETTFSSEQAVRMGVAHDLKSWLNQKFSRMVHIIHPDAKVQWRKDYGFPDNYEPDTNF